VLDSLKCWSALNGTIKQVYGDLCHLGVELTAFCLDATQKRFVVGDSRGGVRVFNRLSGELMKTLKEHQGEVLKVLTAQTKEMNFVISIGSDNLILVHEDDKVSFVLIEDGRACRP